ncbi:methyltransferase domain-containing protein [Patescibacteria group bacterium]|nr:methyltransferase domain-containing protein [Patescibacteria group bacterium]
MLLDDFIRFLRERKVKKYIQKDIVLCDLGCGPEAHFLNLVKSRIKKGIGIDKKIKKGSKENLEFINLKIQKQIPLPDESVDCITMLAVLEHLNYPERVLEECWRILKKDGYLIITIPAPIADPVLNFLAYKLKVIDAEEIEDHKHYFSVKKLKKPLKQAGFKVLKIKKFEFGFNIFILATKQ